MTDSIKSEVVEDVIEAVEAAPVEAVAVEESIEEKADDLDLVRKAVDEVVAENAATKAALEEFQQKAATLEAELAVKAEALDEMEAKANAPTIITNTKEDNTMESQAQFKTFLSEGIDGLKSKAADLQISVDSQGGYALPEELRQEIINIEHEMSPMRQVASVASAATTDVKQLVSIGDAASGWVGETASRANTNSPELAQRSAVFGEVYARPMVYQHMLEDAFFGVEGWVTNEVARQFHEAEGNAFLTGDGVNKPVGLFSDQDPSSASAANSTTGKFEVLVSGGNGNLGADDAASIDFLRSVVLATSTGYLPNAKWMMNRSTHNALLELKNGNGEYFLQREITEAGATRLFGFEIIVNDFMPSMPSSGPDAAFAIAFGDFKRGYQIIDRVGVSMLRDPYTQAGAVSFYTRKRVGSMILDAEAVKLVGVTHSA